MKKLLLFAALAIVPFSAQAESKDYNLTVGVNTENIDQVTNAASEVLSALETPSKELFAEGIKKVMVEAKYVAIRGGVSLLFVVLYTVCAVLLFRFSMKTLVKEHKREEHYIFGSISFIGAALLVLFALASSTSAINRFKQAEVMLVAPKYVVAKEILETIRDYQKESK